MLYALYLTAPPSSIEAQPKGVENRRWCHEVDVISDVISSDEISSLRREKSHVVDEMSSLRREKSHVVDPY